MKSRAGQTASRFKSGKDHLPTRMLANRAFVGAETYAAFRSVVSTAKANRTSVLHTVWFELSTERPREVLALASSGIAHMLPVHIALRQIVEDRRMPALSPFVCTFQVRRDDFSAQVSCDQDTKFWFRLEETHERDDITDFFLGGFDPTLAGDLLAMCYRSIGRLPHARLVFGDILSSQLGDAHAVDAVKLRFENYAKAMLRHYGCSIGSAYTVLRRNKFALIIEADRPPEDFTQIITR
jgi:hypothetical protein